MTGFGQIVVAIEALCINIMYEPHIWLCLDLLLLCSLVPTFVPLAMFCAWQLVVAAQVVLVIISDVLRLQWVEVVYRTAGFDPWCVVCLGGHSTGIL